MDKKMINTLRGARPGRSRGKPEPALRAVVANAASVGYLPSQWRDEEEDSSLRSEWQRGGQNDRTILRGAWLALARDRPSRACEWLLRTGETVLRRSYNLLRTTSGLQNDIYTFQFL